MTEKRNIKFYNYGASAYGSPSSDKKLSNVQSCNTIGDVECDGSEASPSFQTPFQRTE